MCEEGGATHAWPGCIAAQHEGKSAALWMECGCEILYSESTHTIWNFYNWNGIPINPLEVSLIPL